MRRASSADGDALVAFNRNIHRQDDSGEPDERVAAWTRDLVERPHPTFSVGDFTLVEDKRTGAIVSSMNLISQVWSFGGIEFKVGRPELVGTDPAYRERGFVRAQFEVIHQLSEERGELVQAITGIPYYYRLFGYEMALALSGGRAGFKTHVPRLKEGDGEPYRLRPATEADIAFLAELYQIGSRRSLVSCVRDEALWRYEISGKSSGNANRFELRVIETPEGESIGYLLHPPHTWGPMLAAIGYEVKPGVSWAAVTPTVVRYLEATGQAYTLEDGTKKELEAFGFWLGAEHPVYQVIADRLPRVRNPYAWYLRIPDLPAFLRRISPVLEARLGASSLVGHSGEFKLSFYTRGLRVVFEHGRVVEVEHWKPTPQGHSGDAGFPGLTFLQLLFGYRSLEELRYAFPDCWAKGDEARVLLEILFPKQASDVWPVA
jgi:hypothetical protein